MSTFIVKPNFNRIRQQLAFPAKSLNMFMRSELHDNFGFYQSNFGIYSYMQLTKRLKYVIHTLFGNPMIWQSHKSCGWDETGALRTGRTELEPCTAKINESWCYDELFDSCFEQFLTWSPNAPVQLDANGEEIVNALVRTLAENATLGARLTLTAGQMYDGNTVEFNDRTSMDIQNLFRKTIGTCRGWVELLREQAVSPAYEHLNVPGMLSATDFDGEKYTGDVIALYDSLRDAAPNDLQSLMDEGGVIGSVAGDFIPLMIVSTSIFKAIATAYNQQCINIACVNPRLSREEFSFNTSRGQRKMYVYYIDQVPVIPIADINYMDRYLKGMTHFAGITASGNISLGSSFAELPDVEDPGVGILIERGTSAKNYGKYDFLAHALFSTAIADTDYIVASQIFVQPA